MIKFDLFDSEITKIELLYIIFSMNLGVGILSLPRILASETRGIDGVLSILISGCVFIMFSWIIARLAASFPKKTYFDYAKLIIPKPLAAVSTFLIGMVFLLTAALEVSAIAKIAKLYMFNETPTLMLSLVFFLVVIYAVAGSRIALLRVNFMFLPIILFITLFVQVINIAFFEYENIKPFMTTEWTSIASGSLHISLSYLGFVIILFYIALLPKSEVKDAPKITAITMGLVTVLFAIVHTFTIGVFTNEVTQNLVFPTIEISKRIELPGEFFERFESIFFTIWTMAIFTTCTMAFDCAINAFGSLRKKTDRFTWILILAPVIFIISAIPATVKDVERLAEIIVYGGIGAAVIVPSLLFLIAKGRGIHENG